MSISVSVNGKVCRPEEAVISVFDRGFLFGDGVYEAGRSYNRCFLYLEEHFARLRIGAGMLKISVPWTDLELKQTLFETASAFKKPNSHFRMVITRGVIDHVGLDVLSDLKPTLVCIVQDLPMNLEQLRKEGLHLLTSTVIRNPRLAQDPNIKTSNYLNSLLALQDVKSRGANDGIMLDSNGNVTEGTTFSIFGVTKDSTLITSSLDIGILDSITRRHVLSIARKIMKVKEGYFPLKEFQSCTEIFIASSIREIIPVRKWDDTVYTLPGKNTQLLQTKLSDEILSYVNSNEKY